MAARRLHGLVYATIGICCLVIVVCSVALGTDEWFRATGLGGFGNMEVNVKVGLWKGKKTNIGSSQGVYDLKLICQSSKCMWSCGTTAELRKEDLKDIISGGQGIICGNSDARSLSSSIQQTEREEPPFLNFALYLLTIVFLAVAILFAVVAGGLALYNTYRTPIQPILSVFGLYIWNAISAICVAFAMIIWGIAFATSLKKNAGVNDTLTGRYNSDGNGQFGISYWILFLGVIFPCVNMGILRYRSWKIVKMEEKNVKVMSQKLESGDILLF